MSPGPAYLQTFFRWGAGKMLIALLRGQAGPGVVVIAPAAARAFLQAADPLPGLTWSEDAAGALAQQAARAVVLVDSFDQERAIRSKLQAAKVPSVGLYGGFVPRIATQRLPGAVLEPGSGRPGGDRRPVAVRYALVCLARVGSDYLCSLLRSAGLGDPQEHLREATQPAIEAGMSLAAFFRHLEPHAARRGVFGTKLLIAQFIRACGESGSRADHAARELIASGLAPLRLTRDPIDGAVSVAIGSKTNVWHVDQARLGALQDAQARVELDERQLLEALYWRIAAEAWADGLFAPADPLKIDYEALDREPKAVIETIAAHLRTDLPAGLEPRGAEAKMSHENPAYARWRRRLCELVLADRAASLDRVMRIAAGLTGGRPIEGLEARLGAAAESAERRLDG